MTVLQQLKYVSTVVKKLKFSAINKFDILFYVHKNS